MVVGVGDGGGGDWKWHPQAPIATFHHWVLGEWCVVVGGGGAHRPPNITQGVEWVEVVVGGGWCWVVVGGGDDW